MTPAEAIALAKEAGMADTAYPIWWQGSERQLLAFANLIEARVREECAKVAETHAAPENVPQCDYDQACADIAAAIRSTDDLSGG